MKRHEGHADFHAADAALEVTLEEIDLNAPNYNEWVRSLLAPAARGKVLELGAGRGTFSPSLLRSADQVVAVEPGDRAFAALEQTASEYDEIVAIHGYALDASAYGPFDGAVMSNVLEHIEDDENVLRDLFGLLRAGGQVAVFSPAFELLMSDFDRSIGHVRRYSLDGLRSRVEKAGFEVVIAKYVNVPGFFAWFLFARVLKRRPTSSRLIQPYDRYVVRAARWIEARVRAPFGQSVLVIGRVPTR